MNSSIQETANQLRQAPIFAECNAQDLARIVPYIEEKILQENDYLFKSGTSVTDLFFIKAGKIRLVSSDRLIAEVSHNFVGEEAAVGAEYYLADAIAVAPTVVLAIHQEALKKLISATPGAKSQFYSSLLNHYTDREIRQIHPDSEKNLIPHLAIGKSLGWLVAVIIPGIVLALVSQTSLDWNAQMFLIIFSATLTMWVLSLVPEFIPGIFSILALLILGIAPSSEILSGFASGSFFMALSLFGMGEVLVASGLTYRLVLLISQFVPKNQFWYALAIFLTGLLLTPILPSANGRIRLVSPLLIDTIESLGFRPRSKAATHLSFAAFSGASLLSYVFLSSKSANFVVYGLLPSQTRQQFTWGYWLLAALVAGVVSIILYMLISLIFFHNREPLKLSRQHIAVQLELLGPVSFSEWIALGSILLFFIGITTSTIHHIELPWIGLGVLYMVLALGAIQKKQFQSQIDWPFLILLGCLVGLSNAMSYLGLDNEIGNHLAWLGAYIHQDFSLFILLLSATIFLLRFAIPNTTAVAIFASIFLPLAESNGINPWIIGFIILNISDGWALPYQCSYYLQFIEEAENQFNPKLMLQSNMLSNIIRILAIFASIPYWKLLGIL
jgi:DASS family divalent anion:Na+ symporter